MALRLSRISRFLVFLLSIFQFSFRPPLFCARVDLKPTGFVNDFAGKLSPEQRDSLEQAVRGIENQTTAEIGIAVINSLEGRNLEEYANDILNTWGIGKKGKDNGVLVLVSLQERKIRIEVGYGLEPVLTDGRCGQIIRDVLTPYFRKGDFYGGLNEAVGKMGQLIAGKNPAEVLPPSQRKYEKPPLFFFLAWQGFCLLFTWGTLGRLGLALQAAIIAFCDVGVAVTARQNSPLAPVFPMLALLVPFFFAFFSGFLAGILQAVLRRRLKSYYGRNWKEHWPAWIGGAASSSGGGGFGGGGGGFGGGGGGGGGASGGW